MKKLSTPIKSRKQTPAKDLAQSPRQSRRASPRKTEVPVVNTPTTRGRAISSDKYLSTNEKKAVKNIFDKQVVTLTYIGLIKDPAKKVETACVLIMNNLHTRQGSTQIKQHDASGSVSEKYKSLKRFIAKLFTEISKSPPSVQSSLEKVVPSALDEENVEETPDLRASETASE